MSSIPLSLISASVSQNCMTNLRACRRYRTEYDNRSILGHQVRPVMEIIWLCEKDIPGIQNDLTLSIVGVPSFLVIAADRIGIPRKVVDQRTLYFYR